MDNETSIETQSNEVQEAGSGELDSAEKPQGGLKERSLKRSNGFYYNASQLRPRGHNLRLWQLPRNKAKVIEFAQTIYDGGIRTPIAVTTFQGDIVIEDGETRWLAVMLLEGTDVRGVLNGVTDDNILGLLGCLEKDTVKIPATSTDPRLNEQDRLRDTIIRNTGQNLCDLELARAMKQFKDWGFNQSEIAKKLGSEQWTQTRVSHIYQLNYATPVMRDLLGQDIVATAAVVHAMRTHKDDAEAFILGAVEDAKAKAIADAEQFEQAAIEAQAEVERLISEGDDSMVEVGPNKRPITKVEHAQRRVADATEKAEVARQVAKRGPRKITAREIDQAAARRNPQAKDNTPLSRAAQADFVDAVRFEAQYCPNAATRARMNSLLVRYGYAEMAPRVDDDGAELPLPSEDVSSEAA